MTDMSIYSGNWGENKTLQSSYIMCILQSMRNSMRPSRRKYGSNKTYLLWEVFYETSPGFLASTTAFLEAPLAAIIDSTDRASDIRLLFITGQRQVQAKVELK